MKILLALLFAIQTWPVYLPGAKIGTPYKYRLSDKISGCHTEASPRSILHTINAVPAGMGVSDDGRIQGTPTDQDAGSYEFGVACTEAKFIVRVKVLPAE